MANQDVRYYLNGLLVNISNNKIKLVASDGHRLSIYEDSLDQTTGYESRIIFPRKGVIELNKLLDDPSVDLKIEFSNSNIRIFIKNLIFSAKLVDSKYPDFGKVFQQDFFNSISIKKLILKDALTRVAILSNEKFRGVRFVLTEKNLRIISNNSEQEEAQEDMEIDYQGVALDVGFNVNYLMDGLNNSATQTVTFSFGDANSSILLTLPGNEEFKYVVMPMRI